MGLKKKKPGDDLLSRNSSTIGAEELNFRVRDGNGCDPLGTVTGNFQNSMILDSSILMGKPSAREFWSNDFVMIKPHDRLVRVS